MCVCVLQGFVDGAGRYLAFHVLEASAFFT